jgi:hypothetical protein
MINMTPSKPKDWEMTYGDVTSRVHTVPEDKLLSALKYAHEKLGRLKTRVSNHVVRFALRIDLDSVRVVKDSVDPDTDLHVELGYVEINEEGDIESYTITKSALESDDGAK